MGAMKQKMLEDMERGGYDSWQEFAESLIGEGGSEREERFIADMVEWTAAGNEPSAKQMAWLQDIHERAEQDRWLDELISRDD